MSGREKVLITGGLGNLGSWLSEYFAKEYEVYVLSKNASKKLNIKYELIQADISDEEALKKALSGFSFEYCIHAASYNEYFEPSYAKKALLINTLGTRNLIEALDKKNLKKFVYFSTFHVYGAFKGVIDESTELLPKNDYASTHLFAEYYVKQMSSSHKLPYIIFRLTNSYGAPKTKEFRKWYLVLNDLAKSAYEKKQIVLQSNGEAKRDFIWMGDVVSIVQKAFCSDEVVNDVYNLSSGKIYSILELAQRVQRVYEKLYSVELPIVINRKDKNKYASLQVDSQKLYSKIEQKIRDRFDEEIEKIFNYLEEQ